jgi:serine/threonine protein kinase/outer membrane protein assembly factor BamB
MMSLVLITKTSCTFATASPHSNTKTTATTTATTEANVSSEGSITTTGSFPWQNQHHHRHHPYLVVATVDGSIMVLDAQTGALVKLFSSGLALVGPSSKLPNGRRIVPGLDGRLYVTTLPEEEKASGGNILQPLEISVLDVLQNPVKTCNDADQNDCGIVTATKSTSLFALDARSGQLIWHQSPNGTTIQHQHEAQSSSTVLLQREDVMVQQISTDSGLSVWNVTLGTFQALEFGGESSRPQEDDSFLPGQGPKSSSSNLLLQPPSSQPTTTTTTTTLLPSVMFGPDGTTLTAVDPHEGTSLWNLEFTTVVASVFGLNGKSWKPLTVLESASSESSSSPEALEPGDTGVTLYRPPSFDQMFVQNERYLEHLDWLYKQSQEKPYYVYHSPFPPIPESMQSRRHTLPKFLLWGGNPEKHFDFMLNNQAQLALPSPDDLYHNFPNHDLRSDGLFLTWPVIAAMLCLTVTIVQRWYNRKKKQWYQDLQAKAEIYLTSTSTDITQGLIESEPGSKPLRFLMHNQRTINLRRTLSVPGDDQPPPGPPRVQNVSMTWIQSANTDGETPKEGTSPASFNGDNPQPTASPASPTLLPEDKPQQEQGVGFLMDGIPLIRYPRYDSEFKEIAALGKGGFGTVFQCQNVLDGREYAIKKVILKSDSKLPQEQFQQQLQRTLREVKSLALLDHPNIVRYYTAWLELDNNADDALVDPSSGASDYYLFSPTNVTTTNEKALEPISSTSNRYASWRRPSLEHLKKMTDFNPLGGWKNAEEEEEIIFSHNIPGVPTELDEYGFTFERSENEESTSSNAEKEPADENNCMALVKYPTSVQEEHSRKGFFSRRSSLASFASSIEESQSMWSKESISQSMPLLKNDAQENKKEESASSSVKHLLYIQMQFCSQKTLADFLCNEEARRGPTGGDSLDIPYALSLFLQIAQGVQHVHTQGLIHRDLKPNNCFIDDVGALKVGDFGLSRESGENRDESNPVIDDNQMEVAGDITAGVGTRSYASPEQMEGSDYDSSTDVFSLGIILFELCYPMYTVCCE